MSVPLTRAVHYGHDIHGKPHILITADWDGKPRLPMFPLRIQRTVEARPLMLTAHERELMGIAARQSPVLLQAVRDDLLCQRATRLLAGEGADDRFAREAQRVFTDQTVPAWVRELAGALKSDRNERSSQLAFDFPHPSMLEQGDHERDDRNR